MSSTFIGIDNGVSGALAIIYPGGDVVVAPTPTITQNRKVGGKTRTRQLFDEQGMADLLSGFDNPVAFIEYAQAMPDQGSSSGFSYGTGYGLWRGMLVMARIPYTVVRPQEWQKAMLVGCDRSDTKSASILVAQRLFPTVSLKRTDKSRNPDHGMSDALLIAEFGRRATTGG